MARIPALITREHIWEAVLLIRRGVVPPQNRSRGYCLVERGRHFPPKYTLSQAHEVATGRLLPTSEFYGGQESNEFLRRRGFRVDECTCGGHGGDRTALPDGMGVRGRSPASHRESQERDAHSQEKGWDVQHLVAHLSDPNCAEDPRAFPRDRDAGGSAGLYSWWADSTAQKLFDEAGLRVGDSGATESCQELALIYVGQTGATSRRARKPSSATLADRVRSNHIGGNVKSSTFRETISAVLLAPLGLTVVQPRKLARNDNERVSEWIKDHLRVSVVPFGDRDSLSHIERTVLGELDPPLNLEDRPSNPVRQRLEALRKVLRVG